ncbi:MAG: nicotinamide riboside transporter PnuC [Succinivibrio sp.]|nr:nicotinamide riboside transporter PnuC [Succinivibrio sp.]
MEFWENSALELVTTVLGIIYLYLEYRASIYLWLLGIIMPALDIYLFATHGMYAYACISGVFVLTAVYGVLCWKLGLPQGEERPIVHLTLRKLMVYLLLMVLLWWLCAFVLRHYTDSEVPWLDSFTTAASLVGILALAAKYAEQWLVWLIVDVVSVVLFVQQSLYFRAVLYAVFALVAIQGYRKWSSLALAR